MNRPISSLLYVANKQFVIKQADQAMRVIDEFGDVLLVKVALKTKKSAGSRNS